jgi:dihydrolipoamide dehydrogenase
MVDLIILGGGPAGYTAAERAGAASLSTVLVEKSRLGGVCLNEGCIPSKTLLYSSKLCSLARASQAYGVRCSGITLDLAALMARKENIVDNLRKGIALTMKKHKVSVESGTGVFLPQEGRSFRVKVGDKIFEGERVLIGTGSEAVRLDVPGAGQDFVYTSREILSVDHIPKRLVIVGGGAIGLEFAAFFAEAGSLVTVIELLSVIGGSIDAEIGRTLKRELEKKGVQFRLESRVIAIGDHTVTCLQGDQSQTVDADIVLMSVGRRPAIKDMGLEHLGVTVEKGALRTDARGRASIEGVWAAGDVNGVSMLAHTAYREADVCVNDMLGIADRINYDAIPWVIYTHPEVAGVGLTEAEAEKRGIEVASAKLPLSYNGRFLAETDGTRGLCKAVVDKNNRTILGVHMVGGSCSEMIFCAGMMVEKKMTVEEVEKSIFPHPTVSEIIKDTMRLCKR